MEAVIFVLLFVSSICSMQVFGQDVDIRSVAEKMTNVAEGGTQSRNLYQQVRHQSPHRIMHFGKRPFLDSRFPRNIDLYQQQLNGAEIPASINSASYINNNRYPYLLSIELEHGQTLQELPEDMTAYELLQPANGLLYNVDQRALQANGAKLSRLMNAEMPESSSNKVSNEAEQVVDSGKQQDQEAISISTRSYQSSRPNSLNRAYISSLLGSFGKGGSMSSNLPGFGYIKKAEPKDNLFMHFGRK